VAGKEDTPAAIDDKADAEKLHVAAASCANGPDEQPRSAAEYLFATNPTDYIRGSL